LYHLPFSLKNSLERLLRRAYLTYGTQNQKKTPKNKKEREGFSAGDVAIG